ncbi:hypothetical protein CEXT_665181 [Caerostris extrusa]|uniref:Uncharacterized protein n=1 Tax=Caerostris extrusa TaxID=172846 RepID=A0AAV4RGN3_CAEEX|nr:hypothetical protein CEXT_665181 [Caerostris extrusa]
MAKVKGMRIIRINNITCTSMFQRNKCLIFDPLYHKDSAMALNIIDNYSRWSKASPVPDIRCLIVAAALVKNWISHFGQLQLIK